MIAKEFPTPKSYSNQSAGFAPLVDCAVHIFEPVLTPSNAVAAVPVTVELAEAVPEPVTVEPPSVVQRATSQILRYPPDWLFIFARRQYLCAVMLLIYTQFQKDWLQ